MDTHNLFLIIGMIAIILGFLGFYLHSEALTYCGVAILGMVVLFGFFTTNYG